MRFEIDDDDSDAEIEPVAPGTSSCTPMDPTYPECCISGDYAC